MGEDISISKIQSSSSSDEVNIYWGLTVCYSDTVQSILMYINEFNPHKNPDNITTVLTIYR